MLKMISVIYSQRTFNIKDPCGNSDTHPQAAGIAQGCPLSPYLFIIAMTALMHEVDEKIETQFPKEDHFICNLLRDLLYADDTLLISSDIDQLQTHFNAVIEVGKRYGLELNFDKTFLLSIRGEGNITNPNGAHLKKISQAMYLGGLLSSDGRAKTEISRRIGEAKQSLQKLEKVWKHANITRKRKKEIHDSCIISKLLYGLESLTLLQIDHQRLDGFYARCLRRIWNIKPAFISRVSNAAVYEVSEANYLSDMIKYRQLSLLGRIACDSNENLVRQLILRIVVSIPVIGSHIVNKDVLEFNGCLVTQLLLNSLLQSMVSNFVI